MKKLTRRSLLKAIGLGGAATALDRPATAQSSSIGNFTLTILHSNDTHDHIEPTRVTARDAAGKDVRLQYGGVARVKTLIDELRRRSTNPVVLDAGDVFQGTLYFTVYRGLADLAYMEAWGVQAQTLGNHEFNKGPAQLAEYLKGASFPVVSANVDVSAEPALRDLVRKSTVLEVRGTRVGVVGVTTPDTAFLSNPGPNVRFLEPLASVQQEVDRLRATGVRHVVLLSHLGYPVDLELAPRLRGVGVIVGGHSHTPLGRFDAPGLNAVSQGDYPTVVRDAAGNPVLVAQVYEWAKLYGSLRVSFDGDGVPQTWTGRAIPVTERLAHDARLAATIRAFQIPIESFNTAVVGQAGVRLNGERNDVRRRETNLGNLIADAMLWRTRGQDTQVALVNGGGVRASVESGQVTNGQVIGVQPFGNTLITIDLKGSELRAALEHGVSDWQNTAGRFLQVGGLKYAFDVARPVGSRIIDVQVGTKEAGYRALDANATYKVVTNNFVAAGGDDFRVLRDASGPRVDTYIPDNNALVEYFAFLKTASPELEGRITIINEPR